VSKRSDTILARKRTDDPAQRTKRGLKRGREEGSVLLRGDWHRNLRYKENGSRKKSRNQNDTGVTIPGSLRALTNRLGK